MSGRPSSRAGQAARPRRQGTDRQFSLSPLPAAHAKRGGQAGPTFEIDPGKLAEEARFDGVFVLRTNAKISPLQRVLRYRDLLLVEDLFRNAQAILRTCPIYHSSDAAIRGHVFCSFLALMLQKEVADLCHSHGLVIEWAYLLRDLDRLQEGDHREGIAAASSDAPVFSVCASKGTTVRDLRGNHGSSISN